MSYRFRLGAFRPTRVILDFIRPAQKIGPKLPSIPEMRIHESRMGIAGKRSVFHLDGTITHEQRRKAA